jgi:hypothetical protein
LSRARPRQLLCKTSRHHQACNVTARMRNGVEPISVAEYKGTGATWKYPS